MRIRQSRTDQEGHRQESAVPWETKLRSFKAVQGWIREANFKGPLFRPIDQHGTVGTGYLVSPSR